MWLKMNLVISFKVATGLVKVSKMERKKSYEKVRKTVRTNVIMWVGIPKGIRRKTVGNHGA